MKKTTVTPVLLLMAAGLFAQTHKPLPMPPDGFGTVPDEKAPELSASVTVTKANTNKTLGAETLKTTKPDESVLIIKDGASAQALKTVFEKAGGDVTNGGQSNFYGLNAAVVTQDGSLLTLNDVTVTTDAEGANAVFSTGEGSCIAIKGIKIHTSKNSSRGLDATYGGTIIAEKVDITTEGAHCAAFATDRGEGTVTVSGGKALTQGDGSPVIYSTGAISVKNITGTATGAEIAVIEGKNNITIENSTLTGGTNRERGSDVNAAIMLYQSMSGDAGVGTSLFSASDSTLTSTASGPFFYVTNTNAEIKLKNVTIINPNEVLIQATGNESERGWGQRGSNGGTLSLTASHQTLSGDIVADAISTVSLVFGAGTKYTGAINAAHTGKVNLSLAKKAVITLTADSYCNALDVEDNSYKNIKTNGHTLFYNKNNKANSYLHGRTILLADGGKLCGIDMQFASLDTKASASPANPVAPVSPAGGMNMKALSVTGVVAVSDNEVTLTTQDGTKYTLSVMEAPSGKGGMNGNPPAPPSGGPDGSIGAPGGNMPNGNPPNGNPPSGKNGKGKHGEMPKHITLEDLQALAGKQVEVKGMMMQEKLVVMQVTEK